MADEAQIRALQRPLAALSGQGLLPHLSEDLRRTRDAAAAALLDTVLDEVPAYSASSNPDVVPELTTHLEQHCEALITLLGQAQTQNFDFVRDHAERRAAQRFPLEALLHTYRCAHKVLFPWVRDAALAVAPESGHVRRVVAAAADFAIEYTDAASTILTSSYVNHTRVLAEAQSDQRAELLNTLLKGYDESDTRAAQLLRRGGYLKQRQTYCVVVARSVNPAEMENPARAQRMADFVGEVLTATSLRTLIGVRDNLVIAIVSSTRRLSGWTAPQSLLADKLERPLRRVGPAAFIGLSNDVPSTSHIPRAAAEARLALDFASYNERVKSYATVSLRQLLIAHAGKRLRSSSPGWLEALGHADRKARGRLTQTLRAYADADMNVLKTAKALSVHPNTIYARTQRISEITGKNPLSYNDLTELLLAADCWVENRA